MDILIIEDEINAIERLKSTIHKIDTNLNVIDVCKSVKEAVIWFQNNNLPDIIFLDIQLSDGISFEIFEIIKITCPIIFLTAFDNYAIDAFKVNSIDYILKPYHINDIKKALDKYKNLENQIGLKYDNELLKKLYKTISIDYKTRFFAKINRTIYSIPVAEILYFKFEDSATILVNNVNKTFVINYSLEVLEEYLNPKLFFRINRKYIVHINSITKMNIYSKSRISIILKNNISEMVSRSKSGKFRSWLDL